jgi:hypothetical protein
MSFKAMAAVTKAWREPTTVLHLLGRMLGLIPVLGSSPTRPTSVMRGVPPDAGPGAYTSTGLPIVTVRSVGSPKYAAGSAALCANARKRTLRH